MTCIDCGQHTAPALDLPLCGPCLTLAIRLCGSGQARVTVIEEAAPRRQKEDPNNDQP